MLLVGVLLDGGLLDKSSASAVSNHQAVSYRYSLILVVECTNRRAVKADSSF
jgi:hypothetical protein